MANDDYKVGRGRPPRQKQFKPGQSGNPRGRPKGAKNLATVLTETINEKVVITEKGRRRTITRLDAAVKQLGNRAESGDLKAIHQLTDLMKWVEGRAEALVPAEETITEADRNVIATINARLTHRDKGDS
jgi:hypothetical protein